MPTVQRRTETMSLRADKGSRRPLYSSAMALRKRTDSTGMHTSHFRGSDDLGSHFLDDVGMARRPTSQITIQCHFLDDVLPSPYRRTSPR